MGGCTGSRCPASVLPPPRKQDFLGGGSQPGKAKDEIFEHGKKMMKREGKILIRGWSFPCWERSFGSISEAVVGKSALNALFFAG